MHTDLKEEKQIIRKRPSEHSLQAEPVLCTYYGRAQSHFLGVEKNLDGNPGKPLRPVCVNNRGTGGPRI